MSYATTAATPYQPPVPSAPASSTGGSSGSSGQTLWSHGSFSFKDLLDIVNPLQHIPVIGSIYRYLTGDEPSGGARIVGDSIFGGPIGFGVSVVSNALLSDSSGHDIGERVLASVFGPRDGAAPTATAVATAASAPTVAAAVATAAQTPAPLAAGPAQPVAMNQLFRSPPSSAPSTPEQAFLAQNAQFQRQMTTARGADGTTLNNHPVPLELSSNMLPVVPPGTHISVAATAASSTAPTAAKPAAAVTPPANAVADPNPIAQKMLDALSKYEQLKKQEDQQNQQDNADPSAPPKVDLTL